jgi:hypothetical protein
LFDLLVFKQIVLAVATLAVVSAAPAANNQPSSGNSGSSATTVNLFSIQCASGNQQTAGDNYNNITQSGEWDCTATPSYFQWADKFIAHGVCQSNGNGGTGGPVASGSNNANNANLGNQQTQNNQCINIPIINSFNTESFNTDN